MKFPIAIVNLLSFSACIPVGARVHEMSVNGGKRNAGGANNMGKKGGNQDLENEVPIFFDGFSGYFSDANQPRVRREWRTVSYDQRIKVAEAVRIMKSTTTLAGRAMYGDLFWNIDDLTMLHACSTTDPRCDQGHYGPHFILFHRAYLLRFERSLLSVDSTIESLPYWEYSKDTNTGECFENPLCYIFSDEFFGDYYGNPSTNYTVTNGLFANLPIAEFEDARFGPTGELAEVSENARCIVESWFTGAQASKCTRCCGKSCDCDGEEGTVWLRNHDDCTAAVARNPDEQTSIDMTRDIQGTALDFFSCTETRNIKNFLDWQDCTEIRQVGCLLLAGLGSSGEQCPELSDQLTWKDPDINPLLLPLCATCTLEGFLFDELTGEYKFPQALHSQAHIRMGRDLLDVTTSPNDVGPFTGYHSNLDRSNMIWMTKLYLEGLENVDTIKNAAKNYGYPESINDVSFLEGTPPLVSERVSGPFSTYDALICGTSDAFDEYTIFGSAWLPGTTGDDVINEGLPFDDIFEDGNGNIIPTSEGNTGYTAKEIIYYSEAVRSEYTYDTMEHLFYDVCDKPERLRQPENCVACNEPCDGEDGHLYPVCIRSMSNNGSETFTSMCARLEDVQFHRMDFYGCGCCPDDDDHDFCDEAARFVLAAPFGA